MTPSERPPTSTPTLWATVALGALFVGHFVWVAAAMLAEPDAVNFGEGITWAGALRVIHGEPLYGDTLRMPHPYFAYPPLVPAILAVFGESFTAARAGALLGELASAAAIAGILRGRGLHRAHVATAVVFFLGAMSTHKFHGLVRVDTLTVAFTLGAVWVTDAAVRAPRVTPRHIALGAIAWALAGMAKPTGMIALAGFAAWALWRRRDVHLRGVLGLCAAAVATWVCLAGVVDVATHGAFTWNVLFAQGASGHDADAFKFTLGAAIYGHQVVYAVGLLGILAADRADPLRVVWTVSAAWLLLSLRKRGCDVNYALELIALSSVAAGVLLARVEERARTGPWGPRALLFAVFAPLIVASWGGHFAASRVDDARAERRELDALVAAMPGPLLIEEPFYAVRHEKPFAPGDAFHVLLLAEDGRLDPSGLLGAVRGKQFSHVIAGAQMLQRPELREAIEGGYRMVWRSRRPILESYLVVYERRD